MSNGDQLNDSTLTYKIAPEAIEGIHLIDRTIPGHKLKKATVTAEELAVPGLWQKVYEETLTTAATSKTISGLDGNTAEQYLIHCRFRNGYAGTTIYGLRFNNDSGTNYQWQRHEGSGATCITDQGTNPTYMHIGYADSGANALCQSDILLYAKSGYSRTARTLEIRNVTTIVSGVAFYGNQWTNTADNITSLVILATQTDGLGVGTFIGLYKRV